MSSSERVLVADSTKVAFRLDRCKFRTKNGTSQAGLGVPNTTTLKNIAVARGVRSTNEWSNSQFSASPSEHKRSVSSAMHLKTDSPFLSKRSAEAAGRWRGNSIASTTIRSSHPSINGPSHLEVYFCRISVSYSASVISYPKAFSFGAMCNDGGRRPARVSPRVLGAIDDRQTPTMTADITMVVTLLNIDTLNAQ